MRTYWLALESSTRRVRAHGRWIRVLAIERDRGSSATVRDAGSEVTVRVWMVRAQVVMVRAQVVRRVLR